MFDANSTTNVALGASIDVSPVNSPQSPVNPYISACRFQDDFLFLRRQKHKRHHYNKHNPWVDPWVHREGDDREGLVTQ